MLPNKLQKKLEDRKANNAFRQLDSTSSLVDFSSNDYLGFSKSEVIFDNAHQYLLDNDLKENGATGSRLLSGNHSLYNSVENHIAQVHNTESALVFNSGYDANVGLLSSVLQRGDIVLYDKLCHASIRDGIALSNAKSYKFKHNDLEDLNGHLERSREVSNETEIYIVTESVFSMDGDSPDIKALNQLCKSYNANLIIDEAHAIGVFGTGLVDEPVFARIITYGKALGCHGAAILGSKNLKDYLINFSRSFIYTTALPQHSLATILMAYNQLIKTNQVQLLSENIEFFTSQLKNIGFKTFPSGEMSEGLRGFINSKSAIHCCIIPGNDNVKHVAQAIQNKGFNVKPILSPTVPVGKERLRFCLHSYNSKAEISEVLSLLATFAK